MDWSLKWEKFWKVFNQDVFRDNVILGLRNTLIIAVAGLAIGLLIGTIIAIIGVSPKYKIGVRILDGMGKVYVAIFRGTPMMVQLLIAYYVLLPACGVQNVDPLTVGIIVFGMNSGAYVSEIMRSGINSIDKGQLEASRAVGLGYGTSMFRVVIPQAIKNILPTIGNEFITLVKETSVLSFITVVDLYTAFSNIGRKNYDKMIPFLVMAAVYVVIVLLITLLIKLIEKLLAKSERKRG